MGGEQKKVLDLIKETKRTVIAKKVLAAGKIPPQEALSYIKEIKGIDGITIGMTSEKEIEETFKLAKKILGCG
jgi:hypothetical protein